MATSPKWWTRNHMAHAVIDILKVSDTETATSQLFGHDFLNTALKLLVGFEPKWLRHFLNIVYGHTSVFERVALFLRRQLHTHVQFVVVQISGRKFEASSLQDAGRSFHYQVVTLDVVFQLIQEIGAGASTRYFFFRIVFVRNYWYAVGNLKL